MRDELLAGELFSTRLEAKVLIEQWRQHYNAIRPHSSLGYRPPAPEIIWRPRPSCRQRLLCPTLPYAALRCAPASPNAGHERPESNVILGIAARGRPHCHDRIVTARENLIAAGADTRECRADVDVGDGTDALQLGAIDMLHGLGR